MWDNVNKAEETGGVRLVGPEARNEQEEMRGNKSNAAAAAINVKKPEPSNSCCYFLSKA